jgi:hypothetical protein
MKRDIEIEKKREKRKERAWRGGRAKQESEGHFLQGQVFFEQVTRGRERRRGRKERGREEKKRKERVVNESL